MERWRKKNTKARSEINFILKQDLKSVFSLYSYFSIPLKIRKIEENSQRILIEDTTFLDERDSRDTELNIFISRYFLWERFGILYRKR